MPLTQVQGQMLTGGALNVGNNTLGAGNASAFKNRIINGQMQIDQRNAGASGTATGYTLDRWQYNASQASRFTWQQNAGSVTPPVGFSNYYGLTVTSTATVGASDFFRIMQVIEGFNCADLAWGTANAQTVTLSFWVRSSLTGTFGGCVQNAATTRSYPFTYTISAANTWEQKSVTIAGDTTGSWPTTNAGCIQVQFGLGVGSTFSGTAGSWAGSNFVSATGATSVVGTNGATFYITGVQLEVGSTATSFDYRPYGTELALCQRYYYQFMGQAANNNFIGIASGVLLTTTTARTTLIHKVPMRASPTITPSASGTLQVQAGASSSTVTGLTAYSGTESALLDFGINTAGTAGQGAAIFSVANTQFLTVSAEL